MSECKHNAVKEREDDWTEVGETIECPDCGEEFYVRFSGVEDKIYYVLKSALTEDL